MLISHTFEDIIFIHVVLCVFNFFFFSICTLIKRAGACTQTNKQPTVRKKKKSLRRTAVDLSAEARTRNVRGRNRSIRLWLNTLIQLVLNRISLSDQWSVRWLGIFGWQICTFCAKTFNSKIVMLQWQMGLIGRVASNCNPSGGKNTRFYLAKRKI